MEREGGVGEVKSVLWTKTLEKIHDVLGIKSLLIVFDTRRTRSTDKHFLLFPARNRN